MNRIESTATLKKRFEIYNKKKMIEDGELYMIDFNFTKKRKEELLKKIRGRK